MFSPLLPSALDARTQAFPVLSVSQIDRIRARSRSRQVAAGDILFEPGDENVPFYVLLSGGMDIVQPEVAGEHLIAKHGPGEFTGEVTMISGRRCLVRGRVTEPGAFLELTGDGFRSLVARDAELKVHSHRPRLGRHNGDARVVRSTSSLHARNKPSRSLRRGRCSLEQRETRSFRSRGRSHFHLAGSPLPGGAVIVRAIRSLTPLV
jgi:CRP-like cAMP-binding protein